MQITSVCKTQTMNLRRKVIEVYYMTLTRLTTLINFAYFAWHCARQVRNHGCDGCLLRSWGMGAWELLRIRVHPVAKAVQPAPLCWRRQGLDKCTCCGASWRPWDGVRMEYLSLKLLYIINSIKQQNNSILCSSHECEMKTFCHFVVHICVVCLFLKVIAFSWWMGHG